MSKDKTIKIQEDYMTWKRNCDWLVIVRLMRQADEGDMAAVKRLKDDYEWPYTPKTTAESLKKETDETMEKND